MITLSPLEYPKLNKIVLTFVKFDKPNKILTFKGDFRAYPGQTFPIFVNNTKFLGRFMISSDDAKHIEILDTSNPDFTIKSDATIYVFETFRVTESNKTVTFQDIYSKCTPEVSKQVTPEFIKNLGVPGFLSGFDKLKLNNLLYDFKHQLPFEVTENFKQIAEFNLNQENVSRFRLLLYSVDSSKKHQMQFNIWCNSDLTKYGIDGCNVIGNFQVKLRKINYIDNVITLGVDIASKTNQGNFITFIGNSWVLADTSSKTLQSTIDLSLKTNILDASTVAVTSETLQRTNLGNETLLSATEYPENNTDTLYQASDGYHLILGTKKPSDVPEGTSFDSATFVANSRAGSYLFITDNNQIFVGKKDSVNNKIVWNELASKTHTYPATDITEDPLHRFVTDDEKDKWNSTIQNVNNSFWKNPVSDETKLPVNATLNTVTLVNRHSKYGNNPVAMQRVNNSDWLPLNIKVFQTDITKRSELYPGLNGSLISPEMLERLGASGIGKQLGTLEQYIHVLTDKIKYSATNNIFLDLVKRTELTTIGNKTVSIGFANANQIGSESVIIGNNIQQTLTNLMVALGSGLICNTNSKVLLGSYNLKNTEHKVVFGDGTSDALRSNLFWIDKNDKVTIKSTGAFKIDGIQETEILTSGGHVSQDSFVKASEFKQFKDNIPSGEFFSFFKHEAKDLANTVPIIVSISAPETLTYYKNKIEA